MKVKKNIKLWLLLGTSAFLIYNILVFVIAGFQDHTATFWVSYVLTILAVAIFSFCFLLAGADAFALNDWIFGFPIMRDSFIYMTIELLFSIVFMSLEKKISWQWSFVSQFVVMVLYCVLMGGVFLYKKKTMSEKESDTNGTQFIDEAITDICCIIDISNNAVIKNDYRILRNKFEQSGHVSLPSLLYLEEDIGRKLKYARVLVEDEEANISELKKIARIASVQLNERNEKAKRI